ncbi:hypothetical protein ACIA5D_42100 [Actinoplanes sp. NPDC051513]|uniref:hypothetical protein n=1 Tax=Actinoplanes sp. NPDC051513 TaxID=3363908 RepID=UPI003792E67C
MLDRLLSRSGPEVPPDLVVPPPVVDEPTQTLKVLPSIPQRVAGRAVIVYEQAPRRPWRLWVFTAVLVSLTIGVVLGQAQAFQPVSRRPSAQAAVVPPVAPSSTPTPVSPLTAPLGKAKALVFEVTGAATVVHVASADLGGQLYSIVGIGGGAAPRVSDSARGPRLELAQTGAEVRLSSKVAWTVRLTASATDQDVDMRAGGLAGIELGGVTARAALMLPKPKGTVKVTATKAVSELRVVTAGAVPVRLRLTAGANVAVVDGKTHRKVKPRTTLTPAGWRSAKFRYDVTTAARVGSISAARL